MKTAMHWLEQELRNLAFDENHHLGMGDIKITQGMLNDLFDRGKEMEKEHIIMAYIFANIEPYLKPVAEYAEQYYKETYTNPDRDENGRI